MPAYVISEVEVIDQAAADRYRQLEGASIERYGGHHLVTGAVPEALEGEWEPGRQLVMVEFPTLQDAERWYASAEYAEALDVRAHALRRRLLIVDAHPAV